MHAIDNTHSLSHARSALDNIAAASPEMKAITVLVLATLTLLVLSVSAWASVKVTAIYGAGAILNHSLPILLVPLITSGVMTHILVVIVTMKPSIQEPEIPNEEVVLSELQQEKMPPVIPAPIVTESNLTPPEARQDEMIPPKPDSVVPPESLEIPPVFVAPIVTESILELSPMHGKLYAIKCKVGDHVQKGQALFEIEAMKMMMTITAQESGKIVEIFVNEGALVEGEQALVRIEKHQE